jgi:hypothetical protein
MQTNRSFNKSLVCLIRKNSQYNLKLIQWRLFKEISTWPIFLVWGMCQINGIAYMFDILLVYYCIQESKINAHNSGYKHKFAKQVKDCSTVNIQSFFSNINAVKMFNRTYRKRYKCSVKPGLLLDIFIDIYYLSTEEKAKWSYSRDKYSNNHLGTRSVLLLH